MKFDITDSGGKILHTHTAPVSGSGYFSYEFRGVMQPGQYFVSASNPVMTTPLKSIFTVVPNELALPSTTPSPNSTMAENVPVTASPSPGLSQTVTPSPSATPLSPLTVIAGLIFCLVFTGLTIRRKQKNQ